MTTGHLIIELLSIDRDLLQAQCEALDHLLEKRSRDLTASGVSLVDDAAYSTMMVRRARLATEHEAVKVQLRDARKALKAPEPAARVVPMRRR